MMWSFFLQFIVLYRVVNVVIASNAMIGEWRNCFESGELHTVRNFLEMCQRRKGGGCYKNRGSSFTDVQKQS